MKLSKKLTGWKNLGLFPRLVAAFVVVGVGGVIAGGAATYFAASDALLGYELDGHRSEFDRKVDAFFGDAKDFHNYDPNILDSAHELLGERARIEVIGSALGGGDLPPESIPIQLRNLLEKSEATHYQRKIEGFRPVLYVGRSIPLSDTSTWTGGGIRLFVAYPLETTLKLAIRTLASTCLIAVFAAAAATFMARRIIRPLRDAISAIGSMQELPKRVPIPVAGWGEIATLNQQLNETSRQLDLSMTELRDSEAGARRFVADVSHELRTPVAALVAVTEVLPAEPGQISDQQSRAVQITQQEVLKLARLIDDLIEISRFDAGHAQLRSSAENLAALTAQSIANRGWDVELELDESLNAMIDARRWDLIVANLVSNAFRHGKPPVRVELLANGSEIILNVTNQGSPIPAEVIPHLFERFYKAEHARTRSEGSGLGLAIAAENIALLGGTITIDSNPDRTCFTVRLPHKPSCEEQKRLGT